MNPRSEPPSLDFSENAHVNPLTGMLIEARPYMRPDDPSQGDRLGKLRLRKHGCPPDKQEKTMWAVREYAKLLSWGWAWAF